MKRQPSVALVHHWIKSMRGGERVLEQFCILFPDAPIYTITSNPKNFSEVLKNREIHNSVIHYLPGGKMHSENYLPLMPLALQAFRIPSKYDVVLSNDAAMVKGIRMGETATHICHCCSPPRYLYDLQDDYLADTSLTGKMKALGLRLATPYLRRFDKASAHRANLFIAISEFVARRIKTHYGRDSVLLSPPVAVADFDPTHEPEDFCLVVSQLVPYKRVDIAVKAFLKMDRRLVVIGEGSEFERLKKMALGSKVQLLGRQPFNVIKSHYERCTAFIFPGIEDFGITPLEAQAAGKPVVAFRGGGALETVVENVTGVFFDDPTPDSLIAAFRTLQQTPIRSTDCRENAEKFAPLEFRRRFKRILVEQYPELFGSYNWGDERVSPTS